MDWDTIQAELAKATGRPPEAIPRPQTPEFYALLTELEERNHALYQAITEALVDGIEPPPPTQRELSREARRAAIRERLLRPFVKRDPTQPRRYRVNRTSVMGVAAVSFIALLWIFQMRTYHPMARSSHSVMASVQPRASTPSASSAMPTAPSTTPPRTSPPLPAPLLPQPPVALGALPIAPPAIRAGSGSSPSSPGGIVVTAAALEKPARMQIIAPASEEARLTLVSATSDRATEGSTGPAAPSGGAVVLTGPAAPKAQVGPAAGVVRLQIGDQFTVVLTTPVAVSTGWRSIPALAVARDGPLAGWKIVGQASLAQDGTTQINWTQALSPDGKVTMPIHGVAYNPKNGIPGVAGVKTVPMAPQTARTVLSGSLAAVGQYVNAQLQAQEVQVSGITATLTTQVPPFWQFVASQLATGFLPAPVQTGGVVLVSEMPAGLAITVFITAPS
jgi:hypothetical protein